jgi:hypothetical protein
MTKGQIEAKQLVNLRLNRWGEAQKKSGQLYFRI